MNLPLRFTWAKYRSRNTGKSPEPLTSTKISSNSAIKVRKVAAYSPLGAMLFINEQKERRGICRKFEEKRKRENEKEREKSVIFSRFNGACPTVNLIRHKPKWS